MMLLHQIISDELYSPFSFIPLKRIVNTLVGMRFLKAQMIMIVDDHVDTGNILRRLLTHAGHEAIYVTGGAEALAMLQHRKLSLMILDLNMPEMDGLTVLRTMNKNEVSKQVKVMMYSSDTDHETKLEATRLGAVDFVIKGSVSFDALLTRIHMHQSDPAVQN